MTMRRIRIAVAGLLGAAGVAALAVTTSGAAGAAHHTGQTPTQVQIIRRATAQFHNIADAEKAGYVLFSDIHDKTCIAMRGMGGMGVHYVNPQLIADPHIRIRHPEALVYAPDKDGTLRLAAVEYLVDKAAWLADNTGRPRLWPHHRFDFTDAPNRYGLDPFYSQHVWAWKDNPAGLLAMWNPTVHCH
jgi:hypothetical protein